MARPKMRSIEYNILRSVIKLIIDSMPIAKQEYNIHNDIKVVPSYPRDITNMYKPSIIVRKVDTNQSKVSIDNFIGQLYDSSSECYSDVSGILHTMMLQFDILSNGNIQNSIISSILSEDIINNIIINDHGRFPLYDFTIDAKNPSIIGNILMTDPCSIVNVVSEVGAPNLNNDYIGVIRQEFVVLQEVIPKQEYVDLSKWIKQSFIIK